MASLFPGRAIQVGERRQVLWDGYGEIRALSIDGLPAVAKLVFPPHRSGVSHHRKLRSYDVELAWYRHHAARSPSRVARLLAGERTDSGWLMVLEDLDAAGYAGRRGSTRRCLDWLARFHLAFFEAAPTGLWPQGTYWHLGTRENELPAIESARIRDAAPELDRRLMASPFRTLVHGDAKVANFCFGADDVAAVDFQYVGAGCAMSDVAYLICGDPDEREALDHYCETLQSLGASPGLVSEARAIYPIAAADFYRFYAGWAPARWRHEHHGQRVIAEVMATL